jgi:hypothetical protein
MISTMARKVILSPISSKQTKKGPNSRRDYLMQKEQPQLGGGLMWDDVSPRNGGNRAQVGDLFGFVFNTVPRGEMPRVEFHKVTGIGDVTERAPEWYVNVGQTDRQVLFLSAKLGELTQEEFVRYGGYKVQGTMYVKRRELIEHLLDLF